MRAYLLASLCTLLSCGDPPPPSDGQVEGSKLALGLVQHLNSSLQLSEAFRCARIQTDRATPRIEGMKISMRRATVAVEGLPKDKNLLIAAVADARGSDEATLQRVASMRAALIKEGVDLVISLGGHGNSTESISAVLSALSAGAPYLTLALPGDRESVPGHRDAVSDLAKTGAKIIDGAQYRVLSLGELNVATMPGTSMRANLVAKNEGCVHTDSDTTELLAYLAQEENDFLLASYAPSRQNHLPATDIGAGGIHVGEEELTPLLKSEKLGLHVHGMIAPIDTGEAGKLRWGPAANSLASGSLDPLDGASSAIVISITGKRVDWKRIRLAP